MSETRLHPVRAVWTDFGGVLTPPIDQDLETFCLRTDTPAEAMRAAMTAVAAPFGSDLMAPLDTPLLSEDEWASRMNAELRLRGIDTDLTGFGKRWFDGRETNEPWRAHLQELRAAGVYVGLLSNMPPAWDPLWRQMICPDGPETLFDGLALSFEIGARKPDRRIFEVAAELAGADPRECLLVDDIERNCAGARAAGWQAIHFTDAQAAAEQLAPRLLPRTTAGPAAT